MKFDSITESLMYDWLIDWLTDWLTDWWCLDWQVHLQYKEWTLVGYRDQLSEGHKFIKFDRKIKMKRRPTTHAKYCHHSEHI